MLFPTFVHINPIKYNGKKTSEFPTNTWRHFIYCVDVVTVYQYNLTVSQGRLHQGAASALIHWRGQALPGRVGPSPTPPGPGPRGVPVLLLVDGPLQPNHLHELCQAHLSAVPQVGGGRPRGREDEFIGGPGKVVVGGKSMQGVPALVASFHRLVLCCSCTDSTFLQAFLKNSIFFVIKCGQETLIVQMAVFLFVAENEASLGFQHFYCVDCNALVFPKGDTPNK